MTERDESLRLFVAVELPEAWREALAATQSNLRKTLPEGDKLRWVRPEGIHLTLKFLGNVAAARRPELESALSTGLAGRTGMTLGLGRAGYFARRSRLTVVWLGIDGEMHALSSLAGAIDSACAAIGFEAETRPFAPHLTLARMPETVALFTATADQVLKPLPPTDAPALEVREVSLMRSHLGPGGARYERLAAFPLG